MTPFCRNVGEYRIEKKLGGGRYGVCYLARDRRGRLAVLKRFRPGMFRKNREKNHHEAVILSGLDHPAVPALLGVLNLRAGYFFVLEYMPGLSLQKWLFRRKKVFSPKEIFRIGSQLGEILVYLHSRNVVHRDISIANVLDDGKRVSLIDFGLARYADGGRIDKGMDYCCFGDLLLYLLYSGYRGEGKGPWHQELPLSPGQRQYLMRLMGLAEPFASTQEVYGGFLKEFATD